MTESRIDDLTPEVRDLLAADMDIPPVSADVRDRLSRRLNVERHEGAAWKGPAELDSDDQPRRQWRRRAVAAVLLVAAAALLLVYALPRNNVKSGATEPELDRHKIDRRDPPALPPVRALQKPVGVPKLATAKRAKAFRVHLVDNTMNKRKLDLHAYVGKDKKAKRLGIKVSQDGWQTPTVWVSDQFLQASAGKGPCTWRLGATNPPTTRNTCNLSGHELLAGYLGELYKRRPTLAPATSHKILFEKISSPRAKFWRSHYAYSKVEIDGNDVAQTQLVYNPTTRFPEVLLTFRPKAAKRFAKITSGNVGKRLALVRNGVVHSAPVINSGITGGKTTITMAGRTVAAVRAQAQTLINSIVAPAKP